jgi:hypothetical protein
MRVPMDLGVGHYDDPPPEQVSAEELAELHAADRYRFANRLSAWVEVDDGAIVKAGYSGNALVGSTTIRIGGRAVAVPGISFPILRETPVIEDGVARFRQTAGGRTGAPLPRRIDRPPFVRIVAPTAWTTLSLTIDAAGATGHQLTGASPFPRHWVYDDAGELSAKSGVIDFSEWTRVHDHDRSPWHAVDRTALVAEVESVQERRLSAELMSGGSPEFRRIDPGTDLVRQGDPGDDLFLILDGILDVVVDGEPLAEIGPGAIVGERAGLETGLRTATLTAKTPVRVAVFPAEVVTSDVRSEVAERHRREQG